MVTVNLYKGTVNGETMYQKSRDEETAKNQMIRRKLNDCGHAQLTDIKLIATNVDPRRKRTRQKEYFAHKSVEYARPYKD
jgi:hypothetical protein